MGRIGDAVVRGARTVRRIPIPSAVSLPALQEARRARPQGGVLKRHGVEVEMIGRTRCIWLDEHRADQGIIVHLHGGAYVSGPFASDWAWLSRQAQAQDCAALMVDYRTAPDHTHPIAIEDTEAVLRALTEDGRLRAGNWVLTGQHAGGGLALTVARRLVEQAAQQESSAAVPAPGAVVAVSPWLDLELVGAGITETGDADPVHERRALRDAARAYAGRTPLSDPDLSPLNASHRGLPPLHLGVGMKDMFLPDVRVLRLQLEEEGVEVAYREVSGRLGLQLFQRRGEDIDRLHREQAEAIAAGLRPAR